MSGILATLLIAGAGFLCVFIWLVYMAFVRAPIRGAGRLSTGDLVLVCVGDSLTHATLSGDYVASLREDLSGGGIQVLNLGQNGDTSEAVLKRVDKIARLQPTFATIMIGVNDVLQGNSGALGENLAAIITRLKDGGASRIALLSIPPLGENLTDETNLCIAGCNRAIEEVAERTGVDYLPIGEALSAQIKSAHRERDGVPGRAFKFPLGGLFWSAAQHYILQRSFDEIGRRAGLKVHSDRVHLTDSSADLIRRLVRGWLTDSASCRA
ncbi:SGNH/GDSL hydrolase family protein [Mesorhizobium loti]|uniref:SGNH hydrolase-type esterase domain-containing protein n=1 Tax=Rhizobium loti TaxID=381 RepID=A0A6M7U5D3_RHILI|nr:SGNH/GDSL hydrolase family protein [Mesorhizobium loti]OBQ62216.1 hypothetical protein A8145_21405 [Mesorhizobium loti]QKC71283.1 SGNH/GDSL hydrolase family protein [Mesorhizobium loti]